MHIIDYFLLFSPLIINFLYTAQQSRIYYLLQDPISSNVIILSNGSLNAPLTVSTLNPLDPLQHWSFVPSSLGGSFVMNRLYPLVADIEERLVFNYQSVLGYEQKDSQNENQRFTYTSGALVSQANTNYRICVLGTVVDICAISTSNQTFTLIPAPSLNPITVINNYQINITLTFNNAPSSLSAGPWNIFAGVSQTLHFFSGSSLMVADSNGELLLSAPQTVVGPLTLTLSPVL